MQSNSLNISHEPEVYILVYINDYADIEIEWFADW